MEHEQITNLADDIDNYCEKNGLEICTMNTITILQERGLLVSQIDCQVKVQITNIDIHKMLNDANITKQADVLYEDIGLQKAFIKGYTEAREKLLKWYDSNLSA